MAKNIIITVWPSHQPVSNPETKKHDVDNVELNNYSLIIMWIMLMWVFFNHTNVLNIFNVMLMNG